jgi:hypothetical protein
MNMLQSTLLSLAALAASSTTALAAPSSVPSAAIVASTFSDGAVAKAYDHCGDADLCATIDYPSGERLSFFSEGAALDQPYIVHVVRTNAQGTVFEYSRRVEIHRREQLTLDRGNVHLDIDANSDGTLHFAFNPIQKGTVQ